MDDKPTNLTEINGEDLKARFVAILQRHSLGQKMHYWFFPETYQAVPGHSVPCYKAYVGLRANLLDPDTMIWFVSVLRFDAEDAAIELNVGEAMTYLQETKAKYLAALHAQANGKGKKPEGGNLWLPGSE